MSETEVVVGFEGTDLADIITDDDLGPGLLKALADADGFFTELLGEGRFDASVTAESVATAIDGRAGDDDITRSIATNVAADASATGVAADGSILGEASVAADVSADAAATGLDGGDGDDRIRATDAAISSSATAEATGVTVTLAVDGSVFGDVDPATAVSASRTQTRSTALGIDGGAGDDEVTNEGLIVAAADATSTSVAVDLSIGVTRDGDVIVETNPDAEVIGGALSDASASSVARAIGIGGGDGSDAVDNFGTIVAGATADVTAVDVSLDLAGSLEGDVEGGGALTDSSAAASAAAVGLDGGDGDDALLNAGSILGSSIANGTSVGVSVGIAFTETGRATGNALSDAGVSASASADGLAGGNGSDALTSLGPMSLVANADATAVAVSLELAGTMTGGAEGGALSDGTATADATASGMSGGDGDDLLDNRGAAATIQTQADANATAVGVSLGVTGQVAVDAAGGTGAGDVTGTVISDSSATATSRAAGLSGDAGIDSIINDAAIASRSDATAKAVSVAIGESFNVGIEVAPEGGVTGAALSDASVTADATALGIDGGDDGDDIVNRGVLSLEADATSKAVAVGIDVAGKVAYAQGEEEPPPAAAAVGDGAVGAVTGQALSDSQSVALATASGIAGGGGADAIDNAGLIVSVAESEATAVAAAFGSNFNVGINVAPEGDVSGAALSDAGVSATAIANGVDGGDDDDTIGNEGTLLSIAGANAVGVAASVTVTGNVAYKGKDENAANDDGTALDQVEGQALTDASTTADAVAAGLAGGGGHDVIENDGVLQLIVAHSDATGVAASIDLAAGVGIESDAKVDVSGAALSDASVTSQALAIGIDGGSGDDSITNEAAVDEVRSIAEATGVAASLSVAGSLSYKGDTSGAIGGSAVSDSSTVALAEAIAVDGSDGDDQIHNEGRIGLVHAGADAAGVAVAVGVTAGLAIEGNAEEVNVTGRSMTDARVDAAAMATGLAGGAGVDDIHNLADIDSVEAISDADGVAVSLDVAGTFSYKGDTDSSVSGQAVSDTSVTSSAAAVAIDGGADDDVITNAGDLNSVYAEADALGVAVAASADVAVTVKGNSTADVEGLALSKASVESDALAIGITGGAGNDEITNTGRLASVESVATTTGVAADANVSGSVTVEGGSQADVSGAALSDTSSRAQATTMGLSGDAGDDDIDNTGDIDVFASSDAKGIAASLSVAGAVTFKGAQEADVESSAASDASVTAVSRAAGIDGGSGADMLENSGDITLMEAGEADATALGVAASVSVGGNLAIKGIATGTTSAVSASNSRVTADAGATGISGGEDDDEIVNSGTIVAYPGADAEGIAASLTVSGSMTGEATGAAMSDADVTARATATGIDGGAGDDSVVNSGTISLMNHGTGDEQIDASALAVSATLTLTGSIAGEATGGAIASARTLSEADAAGIRGGEGADDVDNTGIIAAHVDAEADAVSVSANITVTGEGEAQGSAVADARAIADARASGIAGDAGDDTIDNTGILLLFSDADAAATSVSVNLTGSRGVAVGESVADGSATALARSVGLDGGSGNDELNANGPLIFTQSQAETDTDSVSVNITGAIGMASGATVADSSADSLAYSAAVDGGAGVDSITNTSPILTTARSIAEATSTLVGVTFGAGVAESVNASDASANAVATAVGLEGGDDDDELTNSAPIYAGADGVDSMAHATSGSTTVSVTLGIGYTEGDSAASSASLAVANAAGLSGGAGNDSLTNSALLTVGTPEAGSGLGLARAEASSDTVSVTIAGGFNANGASSDASATAVANLSGLSGGDGDDVIDNTGALAVGQDYRLAEAKANARTTSVTVTAGAAVGETASNSSATAIANVAGIDGGAGNDEITNDKLIEVGFAPTNVDRLMSTATAGSDSVSFSASAGAGFQTATADASATAVADVAGIAGGDHDDTIENSGDIEVFSSAGTIATSNANKASLSIGVSGGGAAANASSFAAAIGAGIDGGAGSDSIVTLSNVAVETLARSVSSTTATDLNIVSVGAAVQSAGADSSATASAESRGVYGGSGADTIQVGDLEDPGAFSVEALARSLVNSTSRSSSIAGVSAGPVAQEAQASAATVGHALAVGVDGGEGDDDIDNAANLSVTAETGGSSKSTASTNSGVSVGGGTSGDAASDASATLLAEAVGIRGGPGTLVEGESDADDIMNIAPIAVRAEAAGTSESTATASSPISVFGSAEGSAAADASAVVLAMGVGIDGGAGADVITTREGDGDAGTLDVHSSAKATVTSDARTDAAVAFGDASSKGVSDASANIAAESLGIDGGAGDDEINVQGTVRVTSEAIGNITATADVDAQVVFGAASSGAMTDASAIKYSRSAGVDGGDGADTITNDALLEVRADSGGTVKSTSKAGSDSFFSSASSSTVARASLEGTTSTQGILGGEGDDTILNRGTVSSVSDSVLDVTSQSFATAESTFSSASARARSAAAATGSADALGVAGGGGNDVIDNAGVVDATAKGYTKVMSKTVAIARSTFGDEITFAASSNFAEGSAAASGIDGGDGDDVISNARILNVDADASIWLKSLTVSSDGPAISDARTIAMADAAGISGGAGSDTLTNTSGLLVSAQPRVHLANRIQGKSAGGDMSVVLAGSAAGMRGGDGDDVLDNSGDVVAVVGRVSASKVTAASLEGSVELRDSDRHETPAMLVGKWVRIDLDGPEDLYTTIVGFDPATGTMTLADAIPVAVGVGTNYVVLDLDDGAADIVETSFAAGGAVDVDASIISVVDVIGMAGDAGLDVVSNTGDVRAAGSNFIYMGNFNVGAIVRAGLDATSSVSAAGLAGEIVTNAGSVSAESDALLRADGASMAIYANVSQLGSAEASAAGIRGDTVLGNQVDNLGVVDVRSNAEVRSFERAMVIFGSTTQRLDFEALSTAIGLSGGAGDDGIANGTDGVVAVDALASGSILGVTTSFPFLDIGRRTVNFVDATADATASGVDFGAGTNEFDNLGSLAVHAVAAPTYFGSTSCGGYDCLALAISDRSGETSARADAGASARARGVHGDGADAVFNSGTMEVTATALATSYAQAAVIVPVQDQSNITALGGEADRFFDESLQGLAEADLLGKRLRFPGALDLDFLEAESLIEALDADNADQFTDTSYDGDDPVGMRVRFAETGDAFITTVTDYDPDTGVFTLADDVPDDVEADQGYSLSVLTTQIVSFDSSTGEVTLANPLPDGIEVGDAYSLSIISELTAANGFRDETRANDDVPVGTRVTFVGVPGFSATVTAFDAGTGTFTLSSPIPGNVAVLDVYTLSIDVSDGQSGADAQAFAVGMDLGNGGATVLSTGSILVHASSVADTQAYGRGGGAAAAAANGVAEARGIRSGAGGDLVVNEGTMTVTANVVANANTGSIDRRALAIGIETGGGDDTVINRGDLFVAASVSGGATTGLDQVDAFGILTGAGDDMVINIGGIDTGNDVFLAIDTAEGADTVMFGEESSLVGAVRLGAGDDNLVIEGGALIESTGGLPGDVDAGTGTDLLVLDGAGAYDGALVSFEALVKQAPGTFTLAALPTVEFLGIEEGVVRVDDDYVFGAESLYQVPIASDGTHGQFSSAGSVSLAGTLEAMRQTGPYLDGTTFELVVADDGIVEDTTFGALVLPSPTALVEFRYVQLPAVAQVVVDVESFTAYALDPIQLSVAEYLDRVLPGADGDLATVLDHLQLQEAGALPPSYTALSPMHYGVTRRATLESITQHLRSLAHRMSALRLDGAAGGGAGADGEGTYGVWADAYGAFGERDARGGYAAYDVDGWGITAGFDAAVSSQWLLGVSVGYAESDLSFDGYEGRSEQDFTYVSAYASWTGERAYLDGTLLYGTGEQEDERPVDIVGLPRFATSDHDVTSTALSIEGAYDMSSGGDWAWGPFAGLRWVRIDEDDFTEIGAGDVSLMVDGEESESLFGDLGLRVWRPNTGTVGRLVPEFGIAWVHDFDVDDTDVRAGFIGAPVLGFTMPGQGAEEDGLRLSLGLGYDSERRVSTMLRYVGEFRGDVEWHGIQGQLRWEF